MNGSLSIEALDQIPLIEAGDDLVAIIINGLESTGLELQAGDVLVLAQKIVSKAEGRLVDLASVEPSPEALAVAEKTAKDPRLVELILRESLSIVRQVPGVLLTEHAHGWIMANAGIDASNVCSGADDDRVLLLPADPDQTCAAIRVEIGKRLGVDVGVLINDSFGRPWRLGTTGVALGAAGIPSLWDQRGEKDLFGREMQVSQQAVADELAAAASLLQGQGAEGRPIVVVRGFGSIPAATAEQVPAATLIRPKAEDLFR